MKIDRVCIMFAVYVNAEQCKLENLKMLKTSSRTRQRGRNTWGKKFVDITKNIFFRKQKCFRRSFSWVKFSLSLLSPSSKSLLLLPYSLGEIQNIFWKIYFLFDFFSRPSVSESKLCPKKWERKQWKEKSDSAVIAEVSEKFVCSNIYK